MQPGHPSLLSLSKLARENTAFLEGEVVKILGQTDSHALLEEFLRVVEVDGRVSINISLSRLIEVLKALQYLNMFELNASDKEIEQRYNRRERYYPRLLAFLALFPEVRVGRYGLLNLGNMGSPWPGFGGGTFCIVLKPEFLKKLDQAEKLACIKKFSLAYFEDESGEASNEFFSDLSIFEYLPHLALCKHHREVESKHGFWPNMVANAGKMIEIVLFGDLWIDQFEEIRCNSMTWDEFEELEKRNLGVLSAYEELELKAWQELKQKCERYEIPLVKYG